MRLKQPAAAANEELIALVNRGYQVLDRMHADYSERKGKNQFDDSKTTEIYGPWIDDWATDVVEALRRIFPTELETHTFLNPEVPFGAVSGDYNYQSLRRRFTFFIKGLDVIRRDSIPDYTDLPPTARVYVEDIESFRKVRDINRAAVADVLHEGYLDMREDSVQMSLEQILDVPMHKTDWGGEINDLYTANVVVNGRRIDTAFLLKGNGLRTNVMEIAHCGKNGDQILRLVESPARLFIVQFVGNVSESVIRDIDGKIRGLRSSGKEAWYCIMDGQDTARVLRAYGKL